MSPVPWLLVALLSACSGGPAATGVDGAIRDLEAEIAGEAGPCVLEVRSNPGLAYDYGVPEGWVAIEGGGSLLIAPDEVATSGALIYTALLNEDRDAPWFLQSYLDAVATALRGQGDDLVADVPSGGDHRAAAIFEATVGGVPVRGEGKATVVNRFASTALTWSPADGSGADADVLSQVVGCFRRTTELDDGQLQAATSASATAGAGSWGPLVPREEGTYQIAAPEDWIAESAVDGTISGVLVRSPADDASVFSAFMANRYQPSDEQIISWWFSSFGIDASAVPSAFEVPDARVYDFEGTIGGRPCRGMIAIRVDAYLTMFANYVSIAVADPAIWDSAVGTLVEIANSATITDVGHNLASMPALPNLSMGDTMTGLTESSSYRDAVREKASDDWSEAMLGYVDVESPSTGQRWRAPVNSYNPSYGGYVRQLPGGGGIEVLEEK